MAPRYDVREVQDRGHYWQVIYDVTFDNNSTTEHGHSIPKDTLEWRAAEYDLDPTTEFETILDIVLTEPYIAPEDRVVGEGLHDAPDITMARTQHINRCAKAKLKHRISTRQQTGQARNGKAAPHPLDMIRNDAIIDPVVVEIKKEHVRRTRAEHGVRRTESAQSRALRIARELDIEPSSVMPVVPTHDRKEVSQ